MKMNIKISERHKIFFSVVNLFIALFFSTSSGNGGIFSLMIIILSGFFLALGIAFWNFQNLKSKFIENLKFTFGISSFLYILGYIFYALEPIIM